MYETICCSCMRDTGGKYPCSNCGARSIIENEPPALPPRVILHKNYLIGRCLGNGGFGITYLALDIQLKRPVAIKEYFPKQIASRIVNNTTVRPSSQEHAEDFAYGLEKFFEEARMLAQFNYPSIVPIFNSFKENDTAYFVMRYISGKTLAESMKERPNGISEGELLRVMTPVLEGLKEVHAKGLLHRDIKPHNIYIPDNGVPLLLDFGSARQYMVNKNRKFSVFLTQGYAPFEQYMTRAEQGPYTDIYACAATMYSCLRGYNHETDRLEPPIPAPDRKEEDTLPHIQRVTNQQISTRLANAIMKGMEVELKRRPQTVAEFLEMLPSSSEMIDHENRVELLGIAGEYEGLRIPLSSQVMTFGKDPKKCSVVFSDTMISRTHCQIKMMNGIIYVEDLHSTNGTWINDMRQQHAQIRIGDMVSLAGRAVFQVAVAQEVKVKNNPAPVERPVPSLASPPFQSVPQQHLKHAGFWKRFGAWLIDYVLIATMTYVLFLLIKLASATFEFQQAALTENENILITALFLGVSWLYKAGMESSAKQATFGKAAFDIIVTNTNGKRLSFGRATGRHLAKLLSYITIGIGFLMAGFTASKQTLHDKISGTFVIKK